MQSANKYTANRENGAVICENGLPWQPRLFCDERVMAEITDNAVSEIRYFNPNGSGSNIVFRKNFLKATGFYIETEDKNFGLELKNTQMLPLGFEGEWSADGCNFRFSFYTVNNSIIIILKTPDMLTEKCKYRFEIKKNAFFTPQNLERDFKNPQLSGGERVWGVFRSESGVYKTSFCENGCDTCIAMTSNRRSALRITKRNTKYDFYFENISPNTEYVWAVSFAPDEIKAEENCKNAAEDYKRIISERLADYKTAAQKAPAFNTGDKAVDNFMSLAPLYNESLKVRELSGVLRASTKHYFAWGSDSVTEADSLAFWGDNEYSGKIIDYAVSADIPVVCAYGNDGKNLHKTDGFKIGANIFFIAYLYCYVSGGGVLKDSAYAFAKKIFENTLKAYDEKSGMFKTGMSAEFDYSSAFAATHSSADAYGFKENIQTYIAFRSMQVLAYIKGDAETAERITPIMNKFEENADPLFFDDNEGFYSSAVDSKTGDKADIYSPYLARIENEFVSDIIYPRCEALTEYFKKNFVSENGIRPINKNDPAYDGDANQMHCWWPVYNADFYIRCIQSADDRALLEKYVGWVSYWSERLTVPEGIDCYCDNANPDFDDWNMCCGAWQQYNYRAFYQSVVRGVYGLDFDAFGVTVFPHSYRDVSVKNLFMLNRKFDVEIFGVGRYTKKITVNGTELRSTNRIPFDLLRDKNTVLVEKTQEKPDFPQIVRFNSAKILNFQADAEKIVCNVEIPYHAVLAVAGNVGEILVDGKVTVLRPSGDTKTAVINGSGVKKLEIIRGGFE